MLTRSGHLIEEEGMSYLADLDPDNPLTPLQAASCTYRIAMGPRAVQKALGLRTVPGRQEKGTSALRAEAHGLGAPAQARLRYRPRTLPAVWRRVQDHRCHRGACADCQDTHAPGLACESPTTLTAAAARLVPGGLIIKTRAAPAQRGWRTGAAHARLGRSAGVEIGRLGSPRRPTNPRERGIFTRHRAILRFSPRRYSRAWGKKWFEFPIRSFLLLAKHST